MGIFSGPSQPLAPQILNATQPPPPKTTDPQVGKARSDRKRRALANFGRSNTIATSPQGLPTQAPTARKTLLGQ